jgi:hypothetical protein
MQSTITLSGQTLEINLRVVAFYKEFKSITGQDLLSNPLIEDATGLKIYDYAAAFIAAGHYAHCKVKALDPLLTKEQIQQVIEALDMTEASRIVVEVVSLFKGDGDPNEKPPKKGGKK